MRFGDPEIDELNSAVSIYYYGVVSLTDLELYLGSPLHRRIQISPYTRLNLFFFFFYQFRYIEAPQ